MRHLTSHRIAAVTAGASALGLTGIGPAAAADVSAPDYPPPPVVENYRSPPVNYGYPYQPPPARYGYLPPPPPAYYVPGPVYPAPAYGPPVYRPFYGPRVYAARAWPYGPYWRHYRHRW